MHKLPNDELGEAVKRAREAARREPYECSAFLGLSDKSYISKVERGERTLDALKLVRLAHFLGVPAGVFLRYDEAALADEDPDAYAAARLFVEQQVMGLGTGRFEGPGQVVQSIRSIAAGFRPVGLTYIYIEGYIQRHFPEYAITHERGPVPDSSRRGSDSIDA